MVHGGPTYPATDSGLDPWIHRWTNVWAWDDFESVPIADPALEAIRKRAIPMGPPNADVEGILGLLDELRSLCPDVR